MNEAPANSPALELGDGLAGPKHRGEGWSQKKWLTLVAVIFAAHVAIIFALGERKPVSPRAISNVPSLKIAGDSDELIALTDPTLFALPHLEGFAGPAWLEPPRVQFHRQDWTEQPRWLPLSGETLGATFQQFMQTNLFAGRALDFKPEAKLSEPPAVKPELAQNSTMQVEGEFAQRRLINQVNLPSLQYNDVVSASHVQVLVDAAGDVASTVLLESSGYKDADDKALELARTARFTPSSQLTLENLIFNWRTVPLAATNLPATTP
jgi:TonB family protein